MHRECSYPKRQACHNIKKWLTSRVGGIRRRSAANSSWRTLDVDFVHFYGKRAPVKRQKKSQMTWKRPNRAQCARSFLRVRNVNIDHVTTPTMHYFSASLIMRGWESCGGSRQRAKSTDSWAKSEFWTAGISYANNFTSALKIIHSYGFLTIKVRTHCSGLRGRK